MMDIHAPHAHRTGFLTSPYRRLPWTGGASHPSRASFSLLHCAVSPALWPAHFSVPGCEAVLSWAPGLVLGQRPVLTRVGSQSPWGGWTLGHYCCPQPPPRFPEGPAGGGSSSGSSCEEPQWSGGPPALVHGRSTSEAGPGSAPRGHRSSWRPVLLRQVLGTCISEAPIFSVLVSGVGGPSPGFRGSGPQPTPP